MFNEEKNSEIGKYLVTTRKVSKVVKGGRRFSFSVFVIVGNYKGSIGFGKGNSDSIPGAVSKATALAIKSMQTFFNSSNGILTIPIDIHNKFCATKIIIKRTKEGFGVKGCEVVRNFAELLGVNNMNCKVIGSSNKINIIKCLFFSFNIIKNKLKNSSIVNDKISYC